MRLLTVVHQLGERPGEPPFIDAESHLQHLDHLVRHPIDLTYVIMDQVRGRGAELETRLADLAERTRQLLDVPRRGRRRPRLLRPFDAGSWQRRDDALAVLGCRGLLRVEPMPDGDELRYRLTSAGARWLRDAVYPRQDGGRERCALLRAVLPADLLRPPSGTALAAYLRDTRRRLDAFRTDERIGPEDDLLGRLFQSTFAEAL